MSQYIFAYHKCCFETLQNVYIKRINYSLFVPTKNLRGIAINFLILVSHGNVFLQDVNPESENRVNEIGSESQNNEVRVQFADEVPNDNSQQELTPLDESETDEDENRNKRFLFGFGGGAGGGAGSGNFLFDIIRVSRGIDFRYTFL